MFKTITNNVSSEIVEKKSKFIGNLFYIETQNEAEEIIKEVRKKYHDARHNCIAYRVWDNNTIIEKSSDDGEPSGTAGAPMLDILKKHNLCNVLIIVTRYFGGILLGTGGLVRAYSDATIKAIEGANLVEKAIGYEMVVQVDYNNFEAFKYYCKNNKIKISNVEYLDIINCNIEMEEDEREKIIEDYKKKVINVINIKQLEKKMVEI